MSDINLPLALIGGLIVTLGVVSDLLKQRATFLSEPLVAVAYGVIVGPAGGGLVRVSSFGDPIVILEQASRLTLGLAVMSAAIRIPDEYVLDQSKAMATVLLVIMPGT